ncbi:methyltransferase [Parasedimentitalea maritima]|uniref:Phospholipid methyltransferase n=1 Tax=Parasedimentitalea maritima TaxID=2578117 RepID=A0A6A4RE43_9RHOB|nr:methyltransferase [Zongyanglinia marina]KAE9631137.1 hypothetical protein GP644_07960 [Zongyanglinia marina]
MTSLRDIRGRSTLWDILEGQPQHIGLAILLVVGANSLLDRPSEASYLLGYSSAGWATLSIGLAVIHQVIVAIVFRLQLHRNLFTRWFGNRDMTVWRLIFLPLLIARPLTVLLVAWTDTADITGVRLIELWAGTALLALAVWAMHSVLVHFTLPRALGGDHFRDTFASMPLVNKGVFKYTSNGMYGVAFLGLWGIALLFGSWNALILALFQQCYIWVHMYCTEAPDMRWIYGKT